MGKKKSSKQRTDFRKKHQGRVRRGDLTREFHSGDDDDLADIVKGERVSGKGELTRKRNVVGVDPDESQESRDLDDTLISGRVISVHGLKSRVLGPAGRLRKARRNERFHLKIRSRS